MKSKPERFIYWKGETPIQKWRLIRATQNALDNAIDKGARYATVAQFTLNGSNVPERYFAPLYIDLDDSDDVYNTLREGALLLRMIESDYDYPLESLRIFLTGGRGLSIEIPAATFGAEEGDLNLPYIYKSIVEKWPFSTIDMSVYSMGKGQLWRLPNLERPNGRYKVPIEAGELLYTACTDLWDMTRNPRLDFEFIDPDEYPVCEALQKEYQFEKKEFYNRREKSGKVIVNGADLKKIPKETFPPCIRAKLDIKGLKNNGNLNFNQSALLLSSYYTNTGLPVDRLIGDAEEFCQNNFNNSRHYPDLEGKKKHLEDMYGYVSKNDSYSFSCGPPRALARDGVIQFECANCPIEKDRSGSKGLKSKEAATPFEIENGQLFLDREVEEQEYLVDEIIGPHKVIILAGDTNVGKSLWSHQTGLSLSMGCKEFLSFEVPKPRKVLFLNIEMSSEALHSRHSLLCDSFPQFKGGSLANFYINTFSSERHLFEDNWERIRTTVKTNDPFDLIVVDNIYACSSTDDERNVELKPLLNSVFEISDIHDSSILLVTHHKKHSPDEILTTNLVRGGSTLTNAADVVIQMGMSLHKPGLRLMKITKNRDRSPNLGKTFGLRLNPTNLWFTNTGLVDEHLHLTSLSGMEASTVLAQMDEKFETSDFVMEVTGLGKSRKTAYNWLDRLEKDGIVKKLHHGKYEKLTK